ncbi:MAG: hypothetical protein LC643_02140, partial [Bacteroidales bacterium]|nr:hypothetical protein [Bacteroidales bacterium]
SYSALTSPLKVLVDVKGLCSLETISLAELDNKEEIRDKTPGFDGFSLPIGTSVNKLNEAFLSICRQNVLYASQHSSAFPVRAGPELTI